jgi:hypothetical protein
VSMTKRRVSPRRSLPVQLLQSVATTVQEPNSHLHAVMDLSL